MDPKSKKYIFNPGAAIAGETRVKRRNTPFSRYEFDFFKNTKFAEVFVELAKLKPHKRKTLDSLPARLKRHSEFFVELGLFVPEDEVAGRVAFKFELSSRLLPLISLEERSRVQKLIKKGGGVFNKECVLLQTSEDRPETPIEGIPPSNDFPNADKVVWVYDPATQMWANYQPEEKLFAKIVRLQKKQISISSFDQATAELLWHARILTAPGDFKRRKLIWDKQLRTIQKTLKTENYGVVRNMINELQVANLKLHFRAMEREGYMDLDEVQVHAKRYIKQNDALLTFLHRQSGSLLRRITQENIIPSYSLISAYLPGADLKKHTDRPQCVWNCSLLVDSIPGDDGTSSWPIFLEVKKGVREINLNLGDAVLYRGTVVPHWRDKLKPGQRQTVGLLHYVPMSFTGGLN